MMAVFATVNSLVQLITTNEMRGRVSGAERTAQKPAAYAEAREEEYYLFVQQRAVECEPRWGDNVASAAPAGHDTGDVARKRPVFKSSLPTAFLRADLRDGPAR